ncbi:SRPBCC family protein [Dictyobacter aurantiacus]|uniref:Activator of Hsp90 ATPase homologue 1/2-like C-terminal domain-containing protein n=1 Tax=Dictyobacter aurantiacus TaxID=1936993 RepID=A0A401ZT73_9CHLR|nr:SRPBCC domain-containing protein [Dictyobacter aurantiacus]GCE09980.1 hypothetical protein KDAU_73090 [Dictyobacter aurantiacus]
MTAHDIVVEATYPQPIWQVWHALTDRAALGTWLMPNDFEARVGHRFTFQVGPQHGWNGIVQCQVIKLVAPHCVAYTWRSGLDQPETIVTFTLESHGEGTFLRLEHAGFEPDNNQKFSLLDILGSGWNTKLLRKNLPAFLRQESAQWNKVPAIIQEGNRL